MSYKYSVQNITFYKADWWTANDVGPLYTTTTSRICFYIDKTQLLNHIVTNIIYLFFSRGEPRGRPLSTHQQPQIYCIWRKRTSASPSSCLNFLKKKQKPRDVAVLYVTMCNIFCYLSRAWRQCSEAIILSIGKHKHVFVMAICWHSVWRQKIVKTERRKKVLLSCWFPFETSRCTSRQKSSFLRVKGFFFF